MRRRRSSRGLETLKRHLRELIQSRKTIIVKTVDGAMVKGRLIGFNLSPPFTLILKDEEGRRIFLNWVRVIEMGENINTIEHHRRGEEWTAEA